MVKWTISTNIIKSTWITVILLRSYFCWRLENYTKNVSYWLHVLLKLNQWVENVLIDFRSDTFSINNNINHKIYNSIPHHRVPGGRWFNRKNGLSQTLLSTTVMTMSEVSRMDKERISTTHHNICIRITSIFHYIRCNIR